MDLINLFIYFRYNILLLLPTRNQGKVFTRNRRLLQRQNANIKQQREVKTNNINGRKGQTAALMYDSYEALIKEVFLIMAMINSKKCCHRFVPKRLDIDIVYSKLLEEVT